MAARERLGRAALIRTRVFCICDRDMAMGVLHKRFGNDGLDRPTHWLWQPGSCSCLAPLC